MKARDAWSEGGQQELESRIRDRVTLRAGSWFPDLAGSPQTQVSTLNVRPRCSLYLVRLTSGDAVRTVLAKVRRDESYGSRGGRGSRPRLRAEQSSVAELTALEYEGLRSIHNAIGSQHPRFGSVRPLDHLEEDAVILMDYVDQPTLRRRLIAQSRLVGAGRPARHPRLPEQAWSNAGAWLRAYHDQPPARYVPARQPASADVVERLAAYGDFLAGRVGGHRLDEAVERAATLAGDVLPEQLPMAIGHGDYVVRNMFVDERGRITVFDPMPRWRTPRYEDLCRFLVGIRLLGIQLHSHGAAYSQRSLDRRERLFLSGYFDDERIPYAQIHCYQLLILLDKWSALVDMPCDPTGWLWRLRTAASAPMNRYLGREAERLLSQLDYGAAAR